MLDTIETTWINGWMSVGLAGLMVVGGLLWILLSRLRKSDIQLAEARAQIERLSSNLSALCAGTAGINRRINQLEQQNRALQMRQEQIESQGQGDCSYGDAIQMVRHGATAPRLVEELGLGHHEANLIVMLHGMKETG